MQKITKKTKFFLDILVKSLSQFKYYREITKGKFTFSLKYLFSIFYLISLISTIVFAIEISVTIIPNIPKFVQTLESHAGTFYPQDLVVNVKNGIVTSNQKEPYYFDSPSIFFANNNGGNHYITVDTKADPSNIKDEKTTILVTKNSVVVSSLNSTSPTYRVYQIDPTTNFTLDKKLYDKTISKVLPTLKYLMSGAIVLVLLIILIWPFIVTILSFAWQLIYLLIISALLFVIVKLMKKDLKFWKVYQLAIHASTLPILLGFITSSVGITMPFLLGSVILIVFMIIVTNQF